MNYLRIINEIPFVEFTSYVNHLITYLLNIMLQVGHILHQGATVQTAEKLYPLSETLK